MRQEFVAAVLGGGVAAAQAEPGQPAAQAAAPSGRVCTESVAHITGDGVRIHTEPSIDAPAVGLAYRSDMVSVDDTSGDGRWKHIADFSRRPHQVASTQGWVSAQYVAETCESGSR